MRNPFNFLAARALRAHFSLNALLMILNSPITFVIVIILTFIVQQGIWFFLGWLALGIIVRILAFFLRRLRSLLLSKHLIIVFRPFSDTNAPLVRQRVVPALACYGKVVLIADNSFVRSSPYWKDRWFVPLQQKGGVEPDDFADLNSMLDPSIYWRDHIKTYLAKASAAIVILDSEYVGPHLLWEIAESLKSLGPDKIIALIRYDAGLLAANELSIAEAYRVKLNKGFRLPKEFFNKVENALKNSSM